MRTRTCVKCDEAKTIRGVWYVQPDPSNRATQFVCETCYKGTAPTTPLAA